MSVLTRVAPDSALRAPQVNARALYHKGSVMDVERVKCTECDAMILPRTAAKYGGMCAPCGAMSESLLEERHEYERDLESGTVFTPSIKERESATTPAEFGAPDSVWELEPEFR